jgi:pimeloyl-ACP methyl ester carboxylesterase
MNMLKHHPERVQSAVLAQPIGRVGPLKPEWNANFKGWTETLTNRPEATQAVLDAFYQKLYAPGFVYCCDREFARTIKAPCLVLAGNDEAHPWPISEELSKLIPGCEFVAEWKTGAALTAARARVMAFFASHTPGRS